MLVVRAPPLAVALALAESSPLAPPGFARRAFGALTRGDDARWAVVGPDGPALVGVVIDTCESRDDVANLVVLGGDPRLGDGDLHAMLGVAERIAGEGPRAFLEVELSAAQRDWERVLVARGYTASFVLEHRTRDVSPCMEVGLPEGFRWEPVTSVTVAALHAVVGVAFAELPGAMFAPLDEFVAATLAGEPRAEVLLQDGVVVGFVRVRAGVDGTAELGSLGLVPSVRGRGLGEAVVARGIAIARGLRPTAITLEVVATNARAARLYERLGFVRDGETPVWRAPLR